MIVLTIALGVIVLALLVVVRRQRRQIAMLRMNVATLWQILTETSDREIKADFDAKAQAHAADEAWLETLPEDHRWEAVRALLIERGILPPPDPPDAAELPGMYL
jgi:predicted Holliday junction resolvase-like endonuclease